MAELSLLCKLSCFGTRETSLGERSVDDDAGGPTLTALLLQLGRFVGFSAKFVA